MRKVVALVLAYSYLRFSHPEQEKGDSQRRQNAARDEWLKRHPGVKLDESLTLADKGVSGFTGQHRTNPDRHALAAFLRLVQEGRVPEGSFLIVENLDRLSREDIIPALSLCLDLIQAGVRIVQLLPLEMVFDANANPMQVMMMIMELSRGHSESVMKSERVGSAWREKKRRARDGEEQRPSKVVVNGQRALTTRTPAWLRVAPDGSWEWVPGARPALRRVLALCLGGYGHATLPRQLNAERVPTFTAHKKAAGHWTPSYVSKLVRDRRLVGEYQPYTGTGKNRRPDGPPIPDHYPAAWTEDEWYAAQAALATRKGRAGRPAKHRVNVFSNLLHDARTGGTHVLANKGPRNSPALLVPYLARHDPAAGPAVSFPFETFESAVLEKLHEVSPAEVLPPAETGADEAMALSGRIQELTGEIEKVKARLRQRYSDALADVLDAHEQEMKDLNDRLRQERQRAAAPLAEAWGQFRSLVEALAAAPDPQDARMRLRAVLRRMVEGIWCLFVARGAVRIAAVQVWFKDDGHRDYLVLHRAGAGGAVAARPAAWWARALADVATPGAFDLRRPADAARLEGWLAAQDVAELRRLLQGAE
jgi:DNA invertase Pin-like site-specific DNA recombinase